MNVRKVGLPEERRGRRRLATMAALRAELRPLLDQMGDIGLALNDHGLAPLPVPPRGFRWATADELKAEYRDIATTRDRRTHIVDMLTGAAPREAVALPVPEPERRDA